MAVPGFVVQSHEMRFEDFDFLDRKEGRYDDEARGFESFDQRAFDHVRSPHIKSRPEVLARLAGKCNTKWDAMQNPRRRYAASTDRGIHA